MKYLLLLLLCSPAQAESWVFQPSYHSGRPAAKAARRPRPEQPRSGYVNSGYRFSRSTINVGGYVFDSLNLRESWVQRNDR